MNFAELTFLLESDENVTKVPKGEFFHYNDGDFIAKHWVSLVGEYATTDTQGYLHTVNKPAILRKADEWYNGVIISKKIWIVYAKHGNFHRLDGPALVKYDYTDTGMKFKVALKNIDKLDKIEEYYINGKEIPKEVIDIYKKLDKEDIQTVEDIDIPDF
jgi:hypothetical protein